MVRLLPEQNRVLLANVAYDPQLGLLPEEVDLDVQFL